RIKKAPAGPVPAGAFSWPLESGRHAPGFQHHAALDQFLAGTLQFLFQTQRVAVGTARQAGAAEQRAAAVDQADVEFSVAVLGRPGDALQGAEGTVGDQKGIVETKGRAHGGNLRNGRAALAAIETVDARPQRKSHNRSEKVLISANQTLN